MKCMQLSIGIDVSKKKLDVYIPNDDPAKRGTTTQVVNNLTGFRTLRDTARRLNARLCFEPTGGYEQALVTFMHRYDVPMVYTPGARVRYYAKSQNRNYKNDKIDARMISEFAANTELRPLVAKDFRRAELNRKYRQYCTYREMAQRFANRRESEPDSDIRADFASEMKRLDKKAEKIIRECVRLAHEDAELGALVDRLCTVDGIAEKTSIGILSELPELGRCKDAQLFALVGIAPMDCQSGDTQWKHAIFGGRNRARVVLYNMATDCKNWNTIIHDYYWKKRAEGHCHNWCMIPTMRKILSLLNRMVRDPSFTLLKAKRDWRPAAKKKAKNATEI